MRRRGFLAGLLALPFVAPIARVAAKVKARLFPVVILGGTGETGAATVAEAFRKVKPGGMIVCLPGEYEIREPIDVSNITVVGSGNDRAFFTWRPS